MYIHYTSIGFPKEEKKTEKKFVRKYLEGCSIIFVPRVGTNIQALKLKITSLTSFNATFSHSIRARKCVFLWNETKYTSNESKKYAICPCSAEPQILWVSKLFHFAEFNSLRSERTSRTRFAEHCFIHSMFIHSWFANDVIMDFFKNKCTNWNRNRSSPLKHQEPH